MKRVTLLILVLLTAVLCLIQTVSATTMGFKDAYDVSNWTFTAPYKGGAVDTSGAPGSVKMTSSWDWNYGNWELAKFELAAPEDALISFHWDYHTTDGAGSKWDRFGWILNGVWKQLTYCNPCEQGWANNNNHIWGDNSFQVKAGDTFGFYFYSDGYYGHATTVISNFKATTPQLDPPAMVPEPASLFLFGVGILGLSRALRKKPIKG